MSTISSKTVKTRKEHTCQGCARVLPKGSKMEVVKAAETGTIISTYWCSVCQAYYNTHMEQGDEITLGELKSEDPQGWEETREKVEAQELKDAYPFQLGTPVRVANRHQINYPCKGVIIEQKTAPNGLRMSKVKFNLIDCWYADQDLKVVKK